MANAPSISDYPAPIPFAHRGGNEVFPENSIAAFQYAYDLGYRFFETDVHFTAGGELVAFHDDNLERSLGLPGKIADMTVRDRQIRLMNGEHRVPLLTDLLSAFPDVFFNIDAKSALAVEPLVATIKAVRAEERVCLASFSKTNLLRLRQLLPETLTAATRNEIMRLRLNLAVPSSSNTSRQHYLEVPAYLLHRHDRLPAFTKRSVVQLHKRDCKLFIWTINQEREIHRLLDIGVDGIFTDKISLLKNVLQARGQWLDSR